MASNLPLITTVPTPFLTVNIKLYSTTAFGIYDLAKQ